MKREVVRMILIGFYSLLGAGGVGALVYGFIINKDIRVFMLFIIGCVVVALAIVGLTILHGWAFGPDK